MSRRDASELALALSQQAEAVCRHYLSNGRRSGKYWQVGDVRNTPGRSMFVRLRDSPKGPAGRWRDAASSEYGDLLDVIRESCGLRDFADVVAEAKRFLRLPPPECEARSGRRAATHAASGSTEAAQRLFTLSRPIAGTLVETYLRCRGLSLCHRMSSLRFLPRCYYRPDKQNRFEMRPAMIAAVTDLDGMITGVHRTWLAPDGRTKAAVETPRKAMGELFGHAVRFGPVGDVMAAGEGIETILSVRTVLPHIPMAAALSAAHLAVILFPKTLRRLYIVRDNDPAGERARDCLAKRAHVAGVEALTLAPALGDFNDDLVAFGVDAVRKNVLGQVAPQDVARRLSLRP